MRTLVSLVVVLALAGCGVSPQSQKALADAQAGCAAGNADACTAAAFQAQANQQEQAANAQAAAGLGAAFLGAALVGADIAAASRPVYVVTPRPVYFRRY
jgi:hypothetical protein